ncbi:MAG TPA: HD domain-containing protein [Calditrichia bacterium]|nr:HD domain-containing protein [Calditrichia bacterium]
MEFSESDFALFIKGVHFASTKHRLQRRKDAAKTPYINHPVEVAETLWRVGEVRDMVTLVAALLHDTIEDTKTSPDEIRKNFGDSVLSVVLELTDDKALPKAARKRLQIESAPFKSNRAKQIKLADKLCNIRDMAHNPPESWEPERLYNYLAWSEKVVSGLRGTNATLEAAYDQVLEESREALKTRFPDANLT